MGYEALGIFAFAFAYVSLFKILGDLGFSMSHVKRVNEGKDLGKCNGTIISIKVFLTIIMGLSALLFFQLQKFLGIQFDSNIVEISIYLFIILIMIININTGFRSIFTAKKEIAKNRLPRFIGRFLIMIFKISVAISGFSVIYLIGAEIIGSILILLFYIYLLRNEPIKKPDMEYFKNYRDFALPVVFIGITLTFMNHIDKVMIGHFTTSLDVGYYYLAQRLTEVFVMFSISISMVFFPYLSGFVKNSQFEKIRILTSKAERYMCLFLFPLIISLFILAEPFLALTFGSDTVNSVSVFRILLLASVINILRQPYGLQLPATDNLSISLNISLVALIINVSLNLLLIPSYFFSIKLFGLGIEGASYATLITLLFQFLCIKYYAKKITGSKSDHRTRKLILTSFIFGTTFFIFFDYEILSYSILISYFFLIIFLTFLLYYTIGEFNRKELNFITNILNPNKMKEYINRELSS
tara:strand:- start:420 stop:1829 length:1410 start_codon:yes stop_codon:yes gene_type:complete